MFLADLAPQKSRNDRRYESDAYFGVAELGGRCGQCEIAERSEPTAARDGCPVYRRNRRLGEIIERAEKLRHGLGVLQALLWRTAHERFQIVQVHARAECFPCAGEDQYQRR